jgi:hypothetical protein
MCPRAPSSSRWPSTMKQMCLMAKKTAISSLSKMLYFYCGPSSLTEKKPNSCHCCPCQRCCTSTPMSVVEASVTRDSSRKIQLTHCCLLLGMWWLSCLRRLDDTRLQGNSSRFDPGFPHSFLSGSRSNNCVS